jgi:hypothetical protein
LIHRFINGGIKLIAADVPGSVDESIPERLSDVLRSDAAHLPMALDGNEAT